MTSEPPVFLVGCHRSGTTLVRYVLDSHPRIACPPESKFIAGWEAFVRYPQGMRGVLQLGWTADRILRAMRETTEAIFTDFSRKQGKSRWVDKTPNYYHLLPFIDELFDRNALYIFLTRHPFTNIASLEVAPPFVVEPPDDPDIARALAQYGRSRTGWARYWLEVNEHITAFMRAYPERSRHIRYEDVVSTPDSAFGAVFTFLGEAFDPQLLTSAFSEYHASGDGDWKIRQTTAIHCHGLTTASGWPKQDRADVWRITAECAQLLGYAEEGSSVPPQESTTQPSGDTVTAALEKPYRARTAELVPISRTHTLIITGPGDVLCVEARVASAMGACRSTKPLQEHMRSLFASGIASSASELGGIVERLLSQDLLVQSAATDVREVCLPDAYGPNVKNRPTIVVVTADRPHSLDRCLRMILAELGESVTQASVLVIDGSKHDSAATRTVVRRLARETTTGIRYVGQEEGWKIRRALAEKGVPEQVLAHGLTPGEIGSNRNIALLLTAGGYLIMLDDDVLCTPWAPSPTSAALTLSGHGDPHEWTYFSSRPEALANLPRVQRDLFAELTAPLGCSLEELIANASSVVTDDMCPHLSKRIDARIPAKVRLAMLGLAGDSARYCSHSVLFRSDRLLTNLLSNPGNLETALRSREVRRVSSSLTITHELDAITYCIGLDNRSLLPPFTPIGRGEDTVFGVLLSIIDTSALAAHLPVAIVHDSTRPAEYGTERLSSARQTRLCEFLVAVLGRPLPLYGNESPEQRMLMIAQALHNLSLCSPEELAEVAVTLAANARWGRLATLEQAMSRVLDRAHAGHQALREYRIVLHESVRDPLYFVPIEFRPISTAGEGFEAMRDFCAHLAAFVEWWPKMWSWGTEGACREALEADAA